MNIHSYLAFATHGDLPQLVAQLEAIPGCSAYPAENQNVLVLVTETAGEGERKELEKELESIAGLGCLAMVGGWTE